MKKINLLTVALVLTALLSGVAYAEDVNATADVSVTAKINAIRLERDLIQKRVLEEKQRLQVVRASTTADVRAKIASTTERLKERKDEIKSDIEKRIGKKLEGERQKIAQRFEEAIKNLNSLVARVESRITKIDATGSSTVSIKASLDLAKANVVLAEADLTVLENMLASSTATSTRKAILSAIKVQSEKTKSSIKLAHQSIVRVINSLKPGQTRKATSTAPTATTTVAATTTIQ